LIPREPTNAMLRAGDQVIDNAMRMHFRWPTAAEVWQAMYDHHVREQAQAMPRAISLPAEWPA
jgi:hypothetical protein